MENAEITYTVTQKEAIVSLIIEMVNSNELITIEELHTSNIINHELRITDEMFEVGRALDVEYAIEIVRHMNDEQKLHVGYLLTRIIDADEPGVREFRLFNEICRRSGIDVVIEGQASKKTSKKQ